MSSKCTITFNNNPLGIYYAGQVVSGTAELITTRPKTIRSILISVSGFAEVRWTENVTKKDAQGNRVKAIETYSSSEMYYSNEKYVYGQSGGTQLELSPGKYAFPFEAIIPPNSPTSLNGAWGQIQHEVSLVVDRVMRYNNIFKQVYTVLSPLDLNLNPFLEKCLHKIEEQTFCWTLCCGNQGPMVMSVKVPFGGYAPGQKVPFDIVLDNQSNINCSDVKVRLMKKIIYSSRSPEIKTKEVQIKVADNHCGEVIKFNKAAFNEFLQIPSTTPSSLEFCSIIKVSYILKFIAKTSCLHSDLVIEFPMVIGTVPLYASTVKDGASSNQPVEMPSYKLIPTPMYEEDVRSEQFESNKFKPRYPVFLNNQNVYKDGAFGPSNPAASPSCNSYPTANVSYVPPNPTTCDIKPSAMPSPSQQVNEKNASKSAANNHSTLEVMGFSLPPDYKPTPIESSLNIGWK